MHTKTHTHLKFCNADTDRLIYTYTVMMFCAHLILLLAFGFIWFLWEPNLDVRQRLASFVMSFVTGFTYSFVIGFTYSFVTGFTYSFVIGLLLLQMFVFVLLTAFLLSWGFTIDTHFVVMA